MKVITLKINSDWIGAALFLFFIVCVYSMLLIEEMKMLNFERCENVCGTSLQGYITAKYSDLVHAFGKPCWISYRQDEKVTRWIWRSLMRRKLFAPLSTIGNITMVECCRVGCSYPLEYWRRLTRATWFINSAMRRGGNA